MILNFLKNICHKMTKSEEKIDKTRNQEMKLIDLVFSLYEYRIRKENLINPKLSKNIKVKGKNIEHIIDVYVEFVQMNNLERTVIKTIDSRVVTIEDVWQFDNLIKDLGCFPKGVLYYNDKIDDEALKIAKNRNIQVIYFDVMEETRKNILQTLDQVLPDSNAIGDPFWTLMEIDEHTKDNTGTYFVLENSIPLFTSRKLAEECCKIQKNYAVFGVSQHHLSVLLSFVENGRCPYQLGIIRPSKQTSDSVDYNVEMYNLNYQIIREIYVR